MSPVWEIVKKRRYVVNGLSEIFSKKYRVDRQVLIQEYVKELNKTDQFKILNCSQELVDRMEDIARRFRIDSDSL